MAMVSTFQKIDGEHVSDNVKSVGQRLDAGMNEAILDFSAVRRVDAKALQALAEIAAIAEGRGVTVSLRGTNVAIYKVLKLVKLAPKFVFLT